MIITKVSITKILYMTLTIACFIAERAKGDNSVRSARMAIDAVSTSPADATMSQSLIDQRGFEEMTSVPTSETTSEPQKTPTTETPDDAIASLSFWGIVRSFFHWIRDDLSESLMGEADGAEGDGNGDGDSAFENASIVSNGNAAETLSTPPHAEIEGRTFGKIRRLQMAMIPIIFKFGVLSAMVAFLVVLGMKTLFLLKVLILMNAAVILGKFLTLKHQTHEHYEHGPWTYNNWNPHAPSHGWQQQQQQQQQHGAPSAPNKEIHLHIHGGGLAHPQVSSSSHISSWDRHHEPYNSYDPSSAGGSDFDNEFSNQGPISALPTKYPANFRKRK